MGASATRRSPHALQPFRRTILVVIAVSSMNTRRAVSSQPCSRIQRRRARATSARCRSAARRLFLNVMPWRAKKRDSALRLAETRHAQDRNELIQREIRLLADNGEDLLRILFQPRRAPSTGYWFGCAIFVKALQPANRRTRADPEMFGRLTSRSSCLHEFNHAMSQVPRIRSRMTSPPANQCSRLALLVGLRNPDSFPLGRAVAAF